MRTHSIQEYVTHIVINEHERTLLRELMGACENLRYPADDPKNTINNNRQIIAIQRVVNDSFWKQFRLV